MKISRILCPTDLSENAEYALQYAIDLAGMYEARLILLHVREPKPPFYTEGIDVETAIELPLEGHADPEAKGPFAHLVDAIRRDGPHLSVVGVRAVGKPFVEILRCARKRQADLIVMGTHGRSALEQMLIGSTAERVVRLSKIPVLTVKHPKTRFTKVM